MTKGLHPASQSPLPGPSPRLRLSSFRPGFVAAHPHLGPRSLGLAVSSFAYSVVCLS